MRVLLIDDLRFPREALAQDNDFTIVRTSQEALDLFANGEEFDAVFFDHDLGGEDTTRRVATFLRERSFLGIPVHNCEYYIHSANPVGAKWLQMELAGLGTRRFDARIIPPGDYFTQ